jgi:glycosyltransferase involved in cell wall biosynthesis
VPVVSIVTPTKNRLKLLQETVQSITAQTFSDWECLVVDDGSSDGTDEFMTDLASRDPRFKYLKREGELAGANVCRNQGIYASTGEFIIFLDSDDLLSPTCLDVRTQHLRSHASLDFMVFQAGTFKERVGDSDILWHPFTPGDDLSRFLQHECVWDITGPIWRRSVFERLGMFDESLRSMQDYDLHIRILANQLTYVKLRLVDHYIRGHNFDQKTSHLHFRSADYIRGVEKLPGRFLEILQQRQLTTWSRVRLIQGLAFSTAENWVKIGEHREASRSWGRQRELGIPTHLYLAGRIALHLLRVSSNPNSLAQRIVNKWKGFVRFRQEPLIPNYSARS